MNDNPLLRKLANFTSLSDPEMNAIRECCGDARVFAAGEDVIAQGEHTGGVKLLLEGFACRYKVLEDGRRQIVAYFVPGDLCDLRVFILKRILGARESDAAGAAPPAIDHAGRRHSDHSEPGQIDPMRGRPCRSGQG